jgi:hypothetical protein
LKKSKILYFFTVLINRRKVNKELAEKYKEDHSLDMFIETSAKTGFNTKNVKYLK